MFVGSVKQMNLLFINVLKLFNTKMVYIFNKYE